MSSQRASDLDPGEGIGLRRNLFVCIFYMRVDLRGVQVFVSEHLLQRFEIHAVGQHQRCRRMTQFMRGKLAGIQTRLKQVFFDQAVYRRDADAVFVP